MINVSGHRIGTEEIEGAILRDKVLRPDSPVGNAVVVGAPHDEKGETPVAFLIPAPGQKLTDDDLARLKNLVRSEKGATAVPSDFLVVSAFPRDAVRQVHAPHAARDPARRAARRHLDAAQPRVVDEIRETVAGVARSAASAEARQIVQTHRYLRVENHRVAPGKAVAVLTSSTTRR